MTNDVEWAQVTRYFDTLCPASDGGTNVLRTKVHARRFVCSIGEVVAIYVFDLGTS